METSPQPCRPGVFGVEASPEVLLGALGLRRAAQRVQLVDDADVGVETGA